MEISWHKHIQSGNCRVSATGSRTWNTTLSKLKGTSHRFHTQMDTLRNVLGEGPACCTRRLRLRGCSCSSSPVTPALLQPSFAGSSPRQEKEPGSGCQDRDRSSHVEQEVGVLGSEGCWVRRAAGRSWARLPAAGCPGARAVPGTPRLLDNRPPFPKPPGTARPSHAEPGDPRRAKSLLARSAGAQGGPAGSPSQPEAALPRQGEGRAGSAAPQHRRQLHAGCPSAVIWSSDIRAGTRPRSLSAQTPKQLSRLPNLVVFPCNVSPGSLPMTSLLHIPSPGRAEGTAGTPRISRAHYAHSLITARAAGDLPGLEGRAEGVEEKKVPMVMLCFPCRAGRATVSHGRY